MLDNREADVVDIGVGDFHSLAAADLQELHLFVGDRSGDPGRMIPGYLDRLSASKEAVTTGRPAVSQSRMPSMGSAPPGRPEQRRVEAGSRFLRSDRLAATSRVGERCGSINAQSGSRCRGSTSWRIPIILRLPRT